MANNLHPPNLVDPNYDKSKKLKPNMLSLSGHSCSKTPANLVPLFAKKCKIKIANGKDAEYIASDDFMEFENETFDDAEEEETVIMHTPPSSLSTNGSVKFQSPQQYIRSNGNVQYRHPLRPHPHHSQSMLSNGHSNNNNHHHHNNNNNGYITYHQPSQYYHPQPQPQPQPQSSNVDNCHRRVQFVHSQPPIQHHPQYNHHQAQIYFNGHHQQIYQAPFNYAYHVHPQVQTQHMNHQILHKQAHIQHTQQPPQQHIHQRLVHQPKTVSNEKAKSNLAQTLLKAQSAHSNNNNKMKRGEVHFPKSDLCGKYEFVRYLGHGSYGHVCEARSLSVEHKFERVAIKKVPHVFRNVQDAKRLLREMVILRTVREHEAIITLIDILPPADISNFDTLYLVFEFVDTDLSQLISSPQNFQRLHAQYIIYQILLGLQYLHSANIVHRDLKPANILVNENVSTKVCDFGLARGITENMLSSNPLPRSKDKIKIKRVFQQSKQEKEKPANEEMRRQLTRHVVTRWYRAPEVILFSQRREYLTAIDMWSVGCILSELLMMIGDDGNFKDRKALFPGRSCFPLSARDPEAYKDSLDQLNCIFTVIGTPTTAEIEKVKDEQARAYLSKYAKHNFTEPMDLSKKFEHASKDELDLLRRLLQFDVEKRITVDEALSHPYLEKVRDLQAERRHKKVVFSFEDVELDMPTIYYLILDEICQYNPGLIH